MDRSRVTLYGDDIYTATKMKGIVTLRDQIIWLEYSCSGIEFEFEGTAIEIAVVSKLQSVNYAWIDICRVVGNSFDSKKYIVNKKEQKKNMEMLASKKYALMED